MKLNSNSSLKLISFFPLLLLLALASYFTYTSYLDYQNTVKFKNKLNANKILKDLSINIAKERGLSATYIGSKGKLAGKALITQRKLTNISIRKFNNYFKNRPIDNTIKRIYKGLTNITNIRKSVDGFKISFDKMFFGYYSKIDSLLFDEYIKIANIQITPKITSEVNFEASLVKEIEKSGQERGFVSYIVAKKMPFTTGEFASWLKTFSEADLTNLNIELTDINLKNRLYAIFHNINARKLYKKLTKAKIQIIQGSDIGYYQIEPFEWFTLMTNKINILDRADSLVALQVSNDIEDWYANDMRPRLTVAIGILILAIFLLIVGFFIDRYIRRSIKELEKLFSKVGQLADIDEEIDFQTTEGIEKGYRIIEIAIDQIQQDKQIALEASKAKSIFLANMSHEIRTPLNGIIGFTELLKNTNISGEERDFVNIIEKSSENLLEIINNILDLSKIESDKIEVEEILFSPITEFENAVEVFGAKAAEKNIRLSFYMDPSLSNYLNGDPTKIKEVLINLLSNAIKFTPIDGEIDVEIKRVGSTDAFGRTKVQFVVKDTGIGISEDKIKTIFDAFSQADSTITRKYGGTGLGLTISSKFISMMGGKLEVESEVGKGTKFFFTLEFDESPSSEFNFKDEFTDFRCALLASDVDKKNHTQYLYDYLKYFGCDVVFFYNYKEIKGLMFRENINFIILDVDYINEREIEDYKTVSIPGIMILKSSQQAVTNKYTNEFIKVLYEPVNVTKLATALEKQKELLPKIAPIKDSEGEKEEYSLDESVVLKTTEEKVAIDHAGSIKILVAEDNDINRKLIKRTLENYGVEVYLAKDGEEALNEVKSRKFDLIFMDIAMPVMDGVESLHAILNYELNTGIKHTPIVALTANALKGDRERFLNEGFDEYVTKPIKGSNIEAMLKMFLKDKFDMSTAEEQNEQNEQKEQKEERETEQNPLEEPKYDIEDTKLEEESSRKLKIDLDSYEDNFYEDSKKDTIDEELKEDNIPFFEEESYDKESSSKEMIDKYEELSEEEVQDQEDRQEIFADESQVPYEDEEFMPKIADSQFEDFSAPEEKEIIKESEEKSKIDALIAEDNVINQKLIEKTLVNLGLNVDIANNGEEAFEKFKNKKYDIVFMDISMPVMDGIEATHEILAYEKENSLSHTPVVALTANALPGDREAFLSEGLDEYISKPIKKEDIIKVLKIFLGYDAGKIRENKVEEKKKDHYYYDFFNEEVIEEEVEQKTEDIEVKDIKIDIVDNIEVKDVLIFKNNIIEAKILKNMVSKMGYDAEYVTNFDDFLSGMDKNQYKIVMFDKEIEFVDSNDIIDKIQRMDKQRDIKTTIVEFVSVQDDGKDADISLVDEVINNVINKKGIREILEKYIR